jgi:2-polyprenyl-3-methyl-5-hydroxy-6-metoxy-1,4-benzoquinol methylase
LGRFVTGLNASGTHAAVNIFMRSLNRMRRVAYTYVGSHFGFGNRISKAIWEEQFAGDSWDYLENLDEEAHYASIVKMYEELTIKNSLLDVGCGKGVLFSYLRQKLDLSKLNYTGIDISANAVEAARAKWPAGSFRQLDFDKHGIDEKFDVIVFNESLYYFTRPLKILERCTARNLNPDGAYIVSMCDYVGHDNIWRQLTKSYRVVKEQQVRNERRQIWDIKVLMKKRQSAV